MFYSHQLLARKAPLGQIWMAATLHSKINRKRLDKLDIIKICEEILNPSVPMALRLSGILMGEFDFVCVPSIYPRIFGMGFDVLCCARNERAGGVVIVYERKVKLLYDDVSRFLVRLVEVLSDYFLRPAR